MQIYRWHSSLRDCLEMTPEVLLIIWRLNVYHHISFCLLVASISSSWLLCMAQHISFWGFLMKISREYSRVVPKMRTTNEHIGGGLWPEMYGTSESHISPRYSDSLYTTIRKLSFVWRGRSSSFYSPTFLFWMGEGLFHVMMLMEFCVVWSVAFWMTDDY